MGKFAAHDQSGQLHIYNVPTDGAGSFHPVYLITEVRAARGCITDTAAVAGAIVGGQLVSLGGLGTTYAMPFVTIESVLPLDGRRLLVINDNNYPFSLGRNPVEPDNTEFVIIQLDALPR